jgi:PTS system fructose-specific IIC component
MLGSALAGLLSMLFGCTLPAPHGGVFVFPVMGHPVLYLIALFAGTLVTAVTLGRWKKPVGSA